MDWISALQALREHLASARTVPEGATPGRITAESADGRMDIRVIGPISWWAGNDMLPVAERLLEERPSAVTLYVDSPGGDLFDACALRAALDASGATVTAQAGAVVASAAVPVYLAAATRTAQSYTRFMIHQPRAGFMAFGTIADIVGALEKFTPTLEAAIGLYRDTIATHVGAEQADAWLAANTDQWMTAAEAAEAGLVTEAPADGADDDPVAQYRNLVQGLASLYRTPTRRH